MDENNIKDLLNEINNLMMLQTLNSGTDKGFQLCKQIEETMNDVKQKIISVYPSCDDYLSNLFNRTFDSSEVRWRLINSVGVSKIILQNFKYAS